MVYLRIKNVVLLIIRVDDKRKMSLRN